METPSRTSWLAFPRVLWLSLAAALGLGLCTLGMGFFGDDYGHILILEGAPGLGKPYDLFRFAGGDVEAVRRLMQLGVYPWWTLPELKLAFFRPLSSALIVLDYHLFGRNPVGYHLHSLAWYLAVVAVYGLMLRRYLPGVLGALALLLFAIDDAHLLPAGWLANRNALVATLPALVGLWLHLEWREHGRRWALPLSLLGLAVGLTGGETALGLFAYVGAYELLSARGTRAARLRGLVPALVLGVGYLLMYRALGYGAHGSGSYLDPLGEPGRYLASAPPRLLVLLGGLFLGAPSNLWSIAAVTRPWLVAAGVLGLGLFLWLLRGAWPGLTDEERRHCRWLFTGAALSLLPVVSVFPDNRLLLVPGVGGCVALAVVLRHAWRLRERGERPRGVRPVAWVFAALHLVLAPLFWPVMVLGVRTVGQGAVDMLEVTEGELDVARIREQHVMVLSAGDPLAGMYMPMLWAFHGKPQARSWRTLSTAPEEHVFTRTGPGSFELELPQGHFHASEFEQVFRGLRYTLAKGAQVDLEDVRVTVLDADAKGPTRIGFELDVPMEDPSLVFLHWREGALRRFTPPPVGTGMKL
jgi:hypothetical protein